MAASLLPDSTSCFFPCPLSFFFFGSFLVHLPFVFPLSSFQVSCACGFVGSMKFLWQFFKIIEKDLSDWLTEMKRSTFMGWCTTNSGDLNLIILKVWNSNNFLPKQLEPGIWCSVTKNAFDVFTAIFWCPFAKSIQCNKLGEQQQLHYMYILHPWMVKRRQSWKIVSLFCIDKHLNCDYGTVWHRCCISIFFCWKVEWLNLQLFHWNHAPKCWNSVRH